VDGRAGRSTWIYRLHRNLRHKRVLTAVTRWNRSTCPMSIGKAFAYLRCVQRHFSTACSRIRRVVLRPSSCRVAPIRTPPVRRVCRHPVGWWMPEKVWRNLVGGARLCKC